MKCNAMILAAGLGKRMRPLTDSCPKPLIKVAGRSMLERAVDHLHQNDISEIVVNSHYLAPMIEKEVNAIKPGAKISHEDTLLETGGGIKKALPLLGEKPFYVLNGDCVWTGSHSLKGMNQFWEEGTMEALLLLVPREKAHGYDGAR